jgi:hypothetical protein
VTAEAWTVHTDRFEDLLKNLNAEALTSNNTKKSDDVSSSDEDEKVIKAQPTFNPRLAHRAKFLRSKNLATVSEKEMKHIFGGDTAPVTPSILPAETPSTVSEPVVSVEEEKTKTKKKKRKHDDESRQHDKKKSNKSKKHKHHS